MKFVFTLQDLRKVVDGDRVLLDDITLAFLPGAKIGVLGHNGAGKSTLLKIMAGVDKEFLGEARPADGLRIGYLAQNPILDDAKTVGEVVDEGVSEVRALLAEFDALNARFGEPLEDDEMNDLLAEQAKLQDRIDAVDAWNLDTTVNVAMTHLRVPPADTPIKVLSGGERRRVALCRLLLARPDMLLLDEPTNHLDAESVQWLEEFLRDYAGTVVAVTHDRYFLDNVAGWILELDRGRGYPFKGNYTGWLEQKSARLAVEEKKAGARQRTLARELDWIKMTPRARHAKGKARLSAYEALRSEEEQRIPETVEISIPQGPRLGDLVLETEGLSKSFGDRTLIKDLSIKIPPGAIIGIVGPNGAGKTTFLRMLMGEEKPDAGTLRTGPTVKLAYVDQARASLDEKRTVWEAIAEGDETIRVGSRDVPTRAYVASFGFKGSDQQKRVSMLSGGERNRLHLAKLLRSGANVVLLDEPSNDLDVDTLRALEEALLGFSGVAIVVSHDRWFLDRIATHVLAFHPGGKVDWVEGNYSWLSTEAS
jgi:energy-dependent translational throttle protein EttA